jgi:hypothetical protein
MKQNISLGIILRFSDKIGVKKYNTIEEHNKIIKKYSECLYGKFGRDLGKNNAYLVNDSQEMDKIILVQRNGKKYELYIATIGRIQYYADKKLVPLYYPEGIKISCWIKVLSLFEKMHDDEFKGWRIRSSKNGIIETLQKSMAGFFVAENKASYTETYKPKANRVKMYEEDSSILLEDFDMFDIYR